MKKGWLIVNAYLKSEKFNEIYEYLVRAAEKNQCELTIVTNEEVLTEFEKLSQQRPDFAIFWDKDIKAAKYLEANNIKLFNSSSAVEICDDKALTYLALCNSDIEMPDTIISPLTFGFENKEKKFLESAIKRINFPFVIKENCGSFGAQVYIVNNKEEAANKIEEIGDKGYIIQEYIQYSKGRDVRINMVGGVPVAAMLRENKDDFRANITNGGTMIKYSPTDEQIDMALKVCERLNLDFAGVDIMFGENDKPVFCEVNSNAHFKNIYDCTGVNVAEHIMDYVIKKIYG